MTSAPDRPQDGIVISLSPGQVRVARIEDDALVTLWLEEPGEHPVPGDLYRGRITALDRAVGAAFLDLGDGLTGFLNTKDTTLSEGDVRLVRIVEEDSGGKAIGVSGRIELVGHGLILTLGGQDIEISKRITDSARRSALAALLRDGAKAEESWLARTAAAGLDDATLTAERDRLRTEAATLSGTGKPGLVRTELDPVCRALRDLATERMQTILIDDGAAFTRARSWAERYRPGLAGRLERTTQRGDLFQALGLDEEIEAALARVHPLPCGGSIALDETPTLTAIDVDRRGATLGTIALNREAAAEIARLIRLRGIGGLIVIDFLRMPNREDRDALCAALSTALARDTIPAQVLGFTRAGLCEITRPRRGRPLRSRLTSECGVCAGTGRVGHPRTTALAAIQAAITAMTADATLAPAIHAAPAIARQLMGTLSRALDEAERQGGRSIAIESDPALAPDRFEILADTQESS